MAAKQLETTTECAEFVSLHDASKKELGTQRLSATPSKQRLYWSNTQAEVQIINTLSSCGRIEIGPPAHQCDYHLYYSVHDHNKLKM